MTNQRRGSVVIVLLLTGCGVSAGSVAATNGLAQLRPSSQWNWSVDGYKDSKIDTDKYSINVQGTGSTSMARLRRIALARAGQIAVEQKRGFFRLEMAKENFLCSGTQYRGQGRVLGGLPVVDVIVTLRDYKESSDDWAAAETVKDMIAKLDAEIENDAEEESAVNVVRVGCGIGVQAAR